MWTTLGSNDYPPGTLANVADPDDLLRVNITL